MAGFKKGALFSVSLGMLGKVFSFASSLLLAFLFGTSLKADIYFYLILVACLLNIWLQNINLNLVIPEFIHKYQKNKTGAIDFANFFIFIYAICAVIIITLSLFFPLEILTFISDFTKRQARHGLVLISLGSVYFCLFFIMNFLINLCESFKLFKVYFLLPLHTFLPLLFLFLIRQTEAMFLGFICAYTIQIFFCFYLLYTEANWYLSFKKPSFTSKFKKDFWAMQPNNFLLMLLNYVPLWLISGLQANLISAINYSRMISDTPQDVLTFKINNVAKIKLTQEAAAENQEGIKNTLLRAERFLAFILIPVCAFTAIFALDIVEMLFMRGNFNFQDAQDTAFFLQFFIIAVIPFSLNTTFTSLLGAMRLIKETVLRYTLINLIFIIIFIFAIKTYGAFIFPSLWLLSNIAILICNIVTAKQFAPFLDYTKHNIKLTFILAGSLLLAYIIKTLNIYTGNIFVKIFINGFTFVILQALLFYKIGYLRQIIKDINIKFPKRKKI